MSLRNQAFRRKNADAMIFRRLVPFAISLLLLAGCSTSPVGLANSRPVKARRLLPDYVLYSSAEPYGAKLVVIRDAARFDALDKVKVLVDGRDVAFLNPGERLDLFVYSGDRILGLAATPGFIDSADVSHSFFFKPGHTYYLRVGVVGHTLDIRQTARID